jgi:hypothetical protein
MHPIKGTGNPALNGVIILIITGSRCGKPINTGPTGPKGQQQPWGVLSRLINASIKDFASVQPSSDSEAHRTRPPDNPPVPPFSAPRSLHRSTRTQHAADFITKMAKGVSFRLSGSPYKNRGSPPRDAPVEEAQEGEHGPGLGQHLPHAQVRHRHLQVTWRLSVADVSR